MKLPDALSFGRSLPLSAFVLHPLTPVIIAAVHVYLSAGHLSKLLGGDVQWTHIWKGFGLWPEPMCSRRWRRAGLPDTVTSTKNNWKQVFAATR